MKTSHLTATIMVGQLAVGALLISGCTTYTPGRTALGGGSTELPGGTIVRLDEPDGGTIQPRPVEQTGTAVTTGTSVQPDPRETFTKFVIPEGASKEDPRAGLKKTATPHVPAPAPSVEAETTPATTPDGKYAVYVVKRGDTAGEIANRHGLTRAEFVRINALANPDRILVGQKLKVPLAGKPLTATKKTDAAASADGVHVVASGETLSEIAATYSMRTADLAAVNGITNPNLIRVGQTLKISKTAARTAAKPAAPKQAPAEKTSEPGAEKTVEDKEPAEPTDAVEDGDPMAELLGMSLDAGAKADRTPPDPVEPVVERASAASASAVREHIVRENEDIFGIAIEYGVRPMDIRRENNMTGSALTPGSVIKIPAMTPEN